MVAVGISSVVPVRTWHSDCWSKQAFQRSLGSDQATNGQISQPNGHSTR
jgi:hypothetical protein